MKYYLAMKRNAGVFFIIVQVLLSSFSSHHVPHCHTHSCLPASNLPSLALSMCLLYLFLDDLCLIIPYYPSLLSSLVTVSLFFISMSLVIFCLLFSFVDQVPIKDEIIWYFSLTFWLISLSIMLSSSIHTVTKGRSSFFLSAVYIP